MPVSAYCPARSADDDARWEALYHLLRPLTRSWVYHAGVPVWQGQEQDIVEDIVQTSLEKIFTYTRNIQARGIPIGSLQRLSIVITRRCFFDLRRKELRLRHFSYDIESSTEQLSLDLLVDPAQEAEEKIYEEWLLAASAQAIAAFSLKLRLAILADLANRSCFDAEPSALQQAFLAADIHLQDYQCPSSPDPAERSRQSALRCMAYKRIAQRVSG
jgi:DNA-directed RNA polymerase specialized sigma24 family protein